MSWNYYNSRFLKSMGISEHGESLVDLMETAQYIRKAYCSSNKCAPNALNSALKKAEPWMNKCPDCGWYLHWKTIKVQNKKEG